MFRGWTFRYRAARASTSFCASRTRSFDRPLPRPPRHRPRPPDGCPARVAEGILPEAVRGPRPTRPRGTDERTVMALRPRARRLWETWRAERRTFRQGLVALALSTAAGFVAGLILSHLTRTLAELPGLIVLIPAAVGMKGTIFGAIGARLGTANAAGVLEPNMEPDGVL